MDSKRYGDLFQLFAKTHHRCHICATPLDIEDYGLAPDILGAEATPTIDHIVPRAHGGDDHPDNLLPACWSCNSRRGTRDAEMARYDERGSYDAPMSTTDLNVTTGVFGIGAGVVAGSVFATEDASGNKQFNWGAAAVAGLITALLVRSSW
jgi:hypothetical protein